jgi:tripartite-type tricarboxylate transporter receptor subunit TctC
MLARFGLTPLGGTPEELSRRVESEIALWRPIVQSARITLD